MATLKQVFSGDFNRFLVQIFLVWGLMVLYFLPAASASWSRKKNYFLFFWNVLELRPDFRSKKKHIPLHLSYVVFIGFKKSYVIKFIYRMMILG